MDASLPTPPAQLCDKDSDQDKFQDSSVVLFLRIDPMVSGSNPLSALLSVTVRRIVSSL